MQLKENGANGENGVIVVKTVVVSELVNVNVTIQSLPVVEAHVLAMMRRQNHATKNAVRMIAYYYTETLFLHNII